MDITNTNHIIVNAGDLLAEAPEFKKIGMRPEVMTILSILHQRDGENCRSDIKISEDGKVAVQRNESERMADSIELLRDPTAKAALSQRLYVSKLNSGKLNSVYNRFLIRGAEISDVNRVLLSPQQREQLAVLMEEHRKAQTLDENIDAQENVLNFTNGFDLTIGDRCNFEPFHVVPDDLTRTKNMQGNINDIQVMLALVTDKIQQNQPPKVGTLAHKTAETNVVATAGV